MNISEIIKNQIEKVNKSVDKNILALGEIIFNNGACQILSQSSVLYELIINDEQNNTTSELALAIEKDNNIIPIVDKKAIGWNPEAFACLLQVQNELHLLQPKALLEHKKYTREGMIKRVLKERILKADKAEYNIQWADNIYGDHLLTNENGVKYKVFLRDFETEIGYSDSMDSKYNKLGTTKHIMYVFSQLRESKTLKNKMGKKFPFIEIFCDPLNDYKITWFYPHVLPTEEKLLISRYFKRSNSIEDNDVKTLLEFIKQAATSNIICIRPEVNEKIEAAFEKDLLENLSQNHEIDFSPIKADLFQYQKEGINFALFKKSAIIADEMGLGKTVQAIGTAILKKQIFDFKKTLIVCPASIKEQWKTEIEKFSNEKALVVLGNPNERALQYQNKDYYFYIVNYETVLRDQTAINNASFDFLILDEAQRAKNYETKTATSLKRIETKHTLIITGTPIENKLIDVFSIMSILDPHFLGPLWEFSYQHCLFDTTRHNKINGYFNLSKLNEKLEKILLRREKRKVLSQLPSLQQKDIIVGFSPLQAEYHASYSKGLAQILRKKFLTPFDLQRMQLLLANMRMVCDSTYLIDDQTNESPKLDKLKDILLNKLEVQNKYCKIIIFSEWIKVHKLIGKILRDNDIGFVELNGKIPVKSRGELIRKFEEKKQYKVFLSTEAGGTGLNLQVADTLINFELPWNPAKKNQRIGRIDRLGQKSNKLTIFNLITRNSIEIQIASGLLVKQSLFDGVLGGDGGNDFVDFSSKGRSQFIQQLEEFIVLSEQNLLKENTEISVGNDSESTEIENSNSPEIEIDLSNDDNEQIIKKEPNIEKGNPYTSDSNKSEEERKTKELEEVMNNGMQFLAGMFKMSTGKNLKTDSQSITIDKDTGEIVMKFKLPT